MGWRERLLSLFKDEESPFSKLEVQTLDLNNFPPNIAVFEAVSLYEACLKADQALRKEGIQGAVWIRNEQEPFLEDRMAALRNLREKSGSYAFDGAQMRSAFGTSLQTDMVKQEDGSYSPRFDTYQKLKAQDVIEPQRLAELHELTKVFGVSTLNVRYQMNEQIDPHYDYRTDSSPLEPQEDKMFLGRPMRILVSRHQPSTIIYNAQGETVPCNTSGNIRGNSQNLLKEAWQPAVGDYVFLCNYTWGIDKSMPHSPPEFKCSNEEDSRVLDIYDVKDGRDRPESETEIESPITEPG